MTKRFNEFATLHEAGRVEQQQGNILAKKSAIFASLNSQLFFNPWTFIPFFHDWMMATDGL